MGFTDLVHVGLAGHIRNGTRVVIYWADEDLWLFSLEAPKQWFLLIGLNHKFEKLQDY